MRVTAQAYQVAMKAGQSESHWIPAFAGMTVRMILCGGVNVAARIAQTPNPHVLLMVDPVNNPRANMLHWRRYRIICH